MPRIAYLYSRYPFLSQTFCDNEMLALESRGWDLVVGSINPPVDSVRHRRLDALKAPVLYAPPPKALQALEDQAKRSGRWPEALVRQHEAAYGPSFKAAERARNALYFADQFQRLGVEHVHVHFANRATHTALFLHAITGIPLSFTTHGQDFMVDLGSDALLNEMCRTAAFSVAVCDYSKNLLEQKCPDAAGKVHRIYNGIHPTEFRPASVQRQGGRLRLTSIGRLIEFKGFHLLLESIALLRDQGVDVSLRLIGTGDWQTRLETQVETLQLRDRVTFLGQRSIEAIKLELEQSDAFPLACIVDQKGASDLLPTVITEAMLTSLPVVSTRVAGVPEMVVDGETGYLTEPNDPVAFAAALARLAADPDQATTMGKAGRLRAEKLFAAEVTLPALAKLFEASIKASPIQSAALPAAEILAFYDGALPGRQEWLQVEGAVLREQGALILASGVRTDTKGWQSLGEDLWPIEWLPDGMALEMEWRGRETWRRKLEAIRTAWSTGIDGEVFLRAARRAVWIATRAEKLPRAPRLLLAPGVEESFSVWMAGQLTGLPVALVFEDGYRWPSELLSHMTKKAALISDARGKFAPQSTAFRAIRKTFGFRLLRLLSRPKARARVIRETRAHFASWLKGGLSA